MMIYLQFPELYWKHSYKFSERQADVIISQIWVADKNNDKMDVYQMLFMSCKGQCAVDHLHFFFFLNEEGN